MVGAVATSSILLTTTWSQNASAQMPPDSTTDIDVEEGTIAENVTSTATNKTTSENITGANSTK